MQLRIFIVALCALIQTSFADTMPEPQKQLIFKDNFKTINGQRWESQTHTFGCNETQFNPANVYKSGPEKALVLSIDQTAFKERPMSGAELKYVQRRLNQKIERDSFKYGEFSVTMKVAKSPGVVSSFFLYRHNPWQEIDIEFVGNDTRQIQFNVFYSDEHVALPNPYGEPVRKTLPFDASEGFHKYTIKWTAHEIIWYVDGVEFHRRTSEDRTPNVDLSLRLNTWVTCEAAADWSGHFDKSSIAKGKKIRSLYKNISVFSID
jgi:beta-glucanase (GH16 family)